MPGVTVTLAMKRYLPLLCVLTALAACSGNGVSVTRQQNMTSDIGPHIRMLATTGEVQTLVYENPIPQDAGNAAVRTAMASARVYPRLLYSETRPTSDAYGYRVVVGFGEWPVGGDSYCRNPELRPRPAAADVTVVTAALCVGNVVVSEAAARSPRLQGAGDPRLNALMEATVQALLAQNDRMRMRMPGGGFGINL
jgi:hypothetical protein